MRADLPLHERLLIALGTCAAAAAVFALVALCTSPVAADHDANDEAWRAEVLAACKPAWDPADPRIVTRDDQTLHDQADATRHDFYVTWGDEDLHAGRHVRRWRWEYDCTHPPAAVVDPTPTPTPRPTPTPTPTPATTWRECPAKPATDDAEWHCHEKPWGDLYHAHGRQGAVPHDHPRD